MSVYDTDTPSDRETAVTAATEAIRSGGLIVLPTDTVYGIAADAFSAQAVEDLLEAKGRGRDVPPPVLVGDPAVLMALAVDVPSYVEALTDAFWPGPLTIILSAQPSLTWDLGNTRGTVALRMPDDEIALEVLRGTGPLAVSSANRHGKSAALSILEAATQLGDAVEVYLDGGPARLGTASTILDATVDPPEIVRDGALDRERIIEEVGDIFTPPAPEPDPAEDSEDEHEDTPDAAAQPEDVNQQPEDADQSEVDQPAAEGTDRGRSPALDLPSDAELAGRNEDRSD